MFLQEISESFIRETELLRIHELPCLDNYTIGQLNPFALSHRDPESSERNENEDNAWFMI